MGGLASVLVQLARCGEHQSLYRASCVGRLSVKHGSLLAGQKSAGIAEEAENVGALAAGQKRAVSAAA